MTISRRALSLVVVTLCGSSASTAAASAAGPGVALAPGRVVFSVNGGGVADNVNGGGATIGVALPNGGAVLVGDAIGPGENGFYAAQLTADGSLDPSFGSAGIAHVTVDTSSFFMPSTMVRQADGKLIVAGYGPQRNLQGSPIVLVRLDPDGSLDESFGTGGIDDLAIQGTGAGLALLHDGEIVVSGATGAQSSAIATDPFAIPETHWVVAVLSRSGAPDPSFGQAGIATLPETGSYGGQVATLADGDIVATGSAEVADLHYTEYLTRLTPTGARDPSFDGGTPLTLVAAPNSMVVNPDGTVVLGLRGSVIRYTAAGALDSGFGSGGLVPIASSDLMQLLPAPDDGALVILQSGSAYGQVIATRLTGGGAIDPTFGGPTGRSLTIPFGGGGSGFVVSVRPRPLGPLAQNSFRDGFFLARPDGSYLSVGGVQVVQGSGEGVGKSIFDFAAAALTSTFAPDPTFGGAVTPLGTDLRVIRQRASTDHARHGIRVELTLSRPGLARVVIRAHGGVVAQNVLPAFGHGETTIPVELTAYGNTLLRSHRGVKVTATATGRDLLTNTAMATASGTLR
ncbi:MAG TPA: hypothetical protein VIJ51_06000 [Solirubrobacteraceae bacterium]